MPDSIFKPKDGFEGPDVPEVDAPTTRGTTPELSKIRRKPPWGVAFIGRILLAAIGATGGLLALLLIKVV